VIASKRFEPQNPEGHEETRRSTTCRAPNNRKENTSFRLVGRICDPLRSSFCAFSVSNHPKKI
ncbi:MAG: hypothetical protein KC496_02070, partial [Anaerolineae bacterium]|nr:hypothetical protein [Anaerolineae bacterium]